MLATQVPGGGAERTWCLPVATRTVQAIILGLGLGCLAVPGLFFLLLWAQLPPENAGWTALALTAPASGLLAWRALAQSAVLTPDTLVVRNLLTTRRVPLADITKVGFRRGLLTVTWACPTEGTGGGRRKRFTIRAAFVPPSSYLAGLRTSADAIAAEIASAAGLPSLPPRGEIVSRPRARIMLAAAVLCFALGIYCGPMQTGNTRLPLVLHGAGGGLYGLGLFALILAYRTIRDHRRKRTRLAGRRGLGARPGHPR